MKKRIIQNHNEAFVELNKYLIKLNSLDTAALDIEELVDSNVNEIIDNLIREVCLSFSSDYIPNIDASIKEIKKIADKLESLLIYTVFIKPYVNEKIRIDENSQEEFKFLFRNKYIKELASLSNSLLALKERIIENNISLESQKPSNIALKLDKYQVALLFKYFSDINLIKINSNQKLANILSELTGFSSQRIRAEALGAIENVKKDIAVDKSKVTGSFYNLRTVKETLNHIITLIDEDQKRLSKVKS